MDYYKIKPNYNSSNIFLIAKKSLLTFLHNHSIVFYIPVIWQEHDTEQGWKKISGQGGSKKYHRMCFNFISKRILLLLHDKAGSND